jgi:SAM-dependent methyltransferase
LRLFRRVHQGYVHQRRTNVLSRHVADLLPPDVSVVDIGTGDGLIAKKLLDRRPDVSLKATDVLVRPDQHIPVEPFDGLRLPFADGAFDAAVLVDVLHHATEPVALLEEAKRVSRGLVIVKDVMTEGLFARQTLHLMERLANTAHGISIPDTFWSQAEWKAAFQRLGLEVDTWHRRLGLYPFPANLIFERRFHFVARLRG